MLVLLLQVPVKLINNKQSPVMFRVWKTRTDSTIQVCMLYKANKLESLKIKNLK